MLISLLCWRQLFIAMRRSCLMEIRKSWSHLSITYRFLSSEDTSGGQNLWAWVYWVRVKVCRGNMRLSFRRICLIWFIIQKKIKGNFLLQNHLGNYYDIWTPCFERQNNLPSIKAHCTGIMAWGTSHGPSNSTPERSRGLQHTATPDVGRADLDLCLVPPWGEHSANYLTRSLEKFLWVSLFPHFADLKIQMRKIKKTVQIQKII